eukprot:Pgem_evm1s15706
MGVLKDIVSTTDKVTEMKIGRQEEESNENKLDYLDVKVHKRIDNKKFYSEIDSNLDYSIELMNDENFMRTDGRIIRICDLQKILLDHCFTR